MNRGYCRVSTQEQGKEGISLQMQEHTIKNYLHHQPVHIYRDVGTGCIESLLGLGLGQNTSMTGDPKTTVNSPAIGLTVSLNDVE